MVREWIRMCSLTIVFFLREFAFLFFIALLFLLRWACHGGIFLSVRKFGDI